MPSHVTWGLDVSTSSRKTAAVALDWSTPGVARIAEVINPLTSAEIAPLIDAHRASSWAVDVPFGWPDQFVELLSVRHDQPWPAERIPAAPERESWRTREVALRATDRFVADHQDIRTRPLPAAFQLLGATAAMWVLVEAELTQRGVVVDRAGLSGSVCETYPAAALSAWQLGRAKRTWAQLQLAFDFLHAGDIDPTRLASDDVCDAIVCSLVARARDLGLTLEPPATDLDAARREGWIHVSCVDRHRLVGL